MVLNIIANEGRKYSKINLTEEEWKEKLTPEQYKILREKGTDIPYAANSIKKNEPAFTDAQPADTNYSALLQNMIRVADGPVSLNLPMKIISFIKMITAFSCIARKYNAAIADLI